jgi:hypothetical protein
MHRLSSVYWVYWDITPLHVSGVSAVHHQEEECLCGKWLLSWQSAGLGGMDWLRRKKLWNTVTSFYVTSENVFVAGSLLINL